MYSSIHYKGKTRSRKKFLMILKKLINRKTIFAVFVLFLMLAFIIVVYCMPLVVKAAGQDYFPEIEGAVILKDAKGEEFYKDYNNKYRLKIAGEKIPSKIEEGLIAVEDKRFYEHIGIDFKGIMRAIATNLQERKVVEGGSTLTQQLAKNCFLSHERTFKRKVDELVYTLILEHNLSKEEILEKYLNKVYFGHGAYGIEAASRVYFDKSVEGLKLSEKALLIGLIRGPYTYSPYRDLEAAKARKETVLSRMLEKDVITIEEAEKASKQEIKLAGKKLGTREAPYFAEEVINRLEKIVDDSIYKGGLRVYTTLDRELQEHGEEIIDNNLPVEEEIEESVSSKKVRQPQGALVAIEPDTGKVRTMVGGRDYEETEYNRAIRQAITPGSIFKTYVYAAALEKHDYHPASLISSEKKVFEKEDGDNYIPANYGGGYYNRDLTIRKAIMKSCNIVATTLHDNIGSKESVNYAKNFGIKSEIKPWLSFPLGPFDVSLLEVTASYSPLANNGVKVEPVFIERIENNQEEVVYESSSRRKYVLDHRVAYQLTNILKDVISPEGTASTIHSRLEFPAAGKTGTARQGSATGFIGYTTGLITGVYVGHDENKNLQGSGATLAAPVWMDFMEEAAEQMKFQEFSVSEDLDKLNICQQSGKIATASCPESSVYRDYFISGRAPEEVCSDHFEFPGFFRSIW